MTDQPKTYAVVIGVNSYTSEQIPDLKYASEDADAFYNLITNESYLGIRRDRAILLKNENASYRKIKSALGSEVAGRADVSDIIYIYFAGRGTIGRDAGFHAEPFLLPSDAQTDALDSTAISFTELARLMTRIDARQVVLILDAGFSGDINGRSITGPGGTLDTAARTKFLDGIAGQRRIVIAACAADQLAQESDEKKQGVFTHYVLEGLHGYADLDGDGKVGIGEFCRYLFNEVSAHTESTGSPMRPIGKGSIPKQFFLIDTTAAGRAAAEQTADTDADSDGRRRELYAQAAQAHKEGDLDGLSFTLQRIVQMYPDDQKARHALKMLGEQIKRKAASVPPGAVDNRAEVESTQAEAESTTALPPRDDRPDSVTHQPSIEGDIESESASAQSLLADADEFEEDIVNETVSVEAESEAPLQKVKKKRRGLWFLIILILLLLLGAAVALIIQPLNRFLPDWLVDVRSSIPAVVLDLEDMVPRDYVNAVAADNSPSPLDQFDRSTPIYRAEPINLTLDQAKEMFRIHDLYERDWSSDALGISNEYAEELGGQVVTDYTTKLMWQQSGSAVGLQYAEIEDYIQKLNAEAFAGYTDWRLPTLTEAMTLLERQALNTDLNLDPLFDDEQRRIWTADSETGKRKWVVYFYDGHCYPDDTRYSTHYVRAVR